MTIFSSVSVADPGSKAATGPTQFYYLKLALKKMATEGIIVSWPLPSPISVEIRYCLAIFFGGKHAKPKQGHLQHFKEKDHVFTCLCTTRSKFWPQEGDPLVVSVSQ